MVLMDNRECRTNRTRQEARYAGLMRLKPPQITDAHAAAAHRDPQGSLTAVFWVGLPPDARSRPRPIYTPSLWRWPVAPRSGLPTRPGCVRFERREMQGFNSLCAARGGGRATECNVTSAFRRGIA